MGDTLRRLRERRHLSLRTLGERTGFSASFLSQVEHGQAVPSIASLERIAGALGVTLAQFFAAAEGDVPPSVVRAGSRRGLGRHWSRARIEVLSAPGTSARLASVLVTLEPGGRSGHDAEPAEHEEFGLVLEGEAVLTLGAERHSLAAGDAATIPPGTPRRWENVARRAARIVVTEAPAARATPRWPRGTPSS